MSALPRPKGWPPYIQLEGRKFRLRREVKNNGGDTFPKGTIMVAGHSRQWGTLRLSAETSCPCGLQHSIRGLDFASVELLPETKLPVVEELCQRGSCGAKAQEPHMCPYQNEINGNSDPEYCNCCDNCYQQCVDDI